MVTALLRRNEVKQKDMRARSDQPQVSAASVYEAELLAVRGALRQRDASLSALAHDLKNSIGCISAYAQLIQRQTVCRPRSEDAADEQYHALLQKRVERLSGIALSMAAYLDHAVAHARSNESAALAAVHNTHPATSDLVAVVRRAIQSSTLAALSQPVTFTTDVDRLEGAWDESSVGRVLDNLLSNAFKYGAPDRPVRVSLSLERGASGGEAVLTVRDEGIGIPAADLQHIFERFHRAANVGTVPGTGVGLAASREMVLRAGGTMDVSSEEGRGTTFTVRLPLPA